MKKKLTFEEEVTSGLEESYLAGHVFKSINENGEVVYSLTKEGKQYVEDKIFPKMGINVRKKNKRSSRTK